MVPIHYNEMAYYIGKRIKMILSRNICLTNIIININLQKTKVKVNLDFKICNSKYTYSRIFIINNKMQNITENLIENIIQDFEKKYKLN